MPAIAPLPPRFLLPAWSKNYLRRWRYINEFYLLALQCHQPQSSWRSKRLSHARVRGTSGRSQLDEHSVREDATGNPVISNEPGPIVTEKSLGDVPNFPNAGLDYVKVSTSVTHAHTPSYGRPLSRLSDSTTPSPRSRTSSTLSSRGSNAISSKPRTASFTREAATSNRAVGARSTGIDATTRLSDISAEYTKPSARSPSLFEELFPSESKRDKQQESRPIPAPEQEVELPHLNLHPRMPKTKHRGRAQSSTNAASLLHPKKWEQDRLTVMVVMGLSPMLDEADFQRLIPRGTHIEEWRTPGDVLRVIPARNRTMLEPTALHYLVFANPAMARAYKAHLEHLHAVARQHTPTSLLAPAAPPRGYYVQGDHVHQILQDYTLCPPSQELRLRILLPPYEHATQALLTEQGYRLLQNNSSAPRAGRAALIWVTGFRPTARHLYAWLARDSQSRGHTWGALRSDRHGAIVPLGTAGSNESSETLRHSDSDDLWNDAGAISQTERTTEHITASVDNSDVVRDSAGMLQTVARPKRPTVGPQRWLLCFGDETEARRFVRVWHRQPFPLPTEAAERRGSDTPPATVHAQFVW